MRICEISNTSEIFLASNLHDCLIHVDMIKERMGLWLKSFILRIIRLSKITATTVGTSLSVSLDSYEVQLCLAYLMAMSYPELGLAIS